MGGVDEMLIRAGKLRPLTSPGALMLTKHDAAEQRVRRDPGLLVELALGALESNP